MFGCFRGARTLRAELAGEFVDRLLRHMKVIGARGVLPKIPASQADMKILLWIDEENFNPNYSPPSMHLLPKRGADSKRQHTQDHWRERDEFPAIDLEGEEFICRRGQGRARRRSRGFNCSKAERKNGAKDKTFSREEIRYQNIYFIIVSSPLCDFTRT